MSEAVDDAAAAAAAAALVVAEDDEYHVPKAWNNSQYSRIESLILLAPISKTFPLSFPFPMRNKDHRTYLSSFAIKGEFSKRFNIVAFP